MLRPRLGNEADREARARIERARNELTEEHLNTLELQAAQVVHGRDPSGLAPRTTQTCTASSAFRSTILPTQCRASSARRSVSGSRPATGSSALASGSGSARCSAGTSAAPLRGVDWDAAFPAEAMLPALEATLAELGIDLHAQQNVELDVEERPNKDPRAFCAPIEVPGPRRPRHQASGRPRRLARTVPRGRSHGAFRPHVGVALAGGDDGSATTRSPRAGRCCSST